MGDHLSDQWTAFSRPISSFGFWSIFRPSRVLLPLAVFALALLSSMTVHAGALWDTDDGGSGFSSAERTTWKLSHGNFSSIDATVQAAIAYCKTLDDYVDPSIDCTLLNNATNEAVTLEWYDGGGPQFEYFTVWIDLYRGNGNGGSFTANWWPYYSPNSACGTGEVVGHTHYDCVDEEYYVQEPVPPQQCSNNESNPCDPATGNKHQVEVDISVPGSDLKFVRYYNSTGTYRTGEGMGTGWRHTYSRRLNEAPDRVPAVTFGTPAAQSSAYSTASTACTSGWDDIKSDAFGGDLSTATASFSGGNLCKISSGGSVVAQLPIRFRHGSFSGFTPSTSNKIITRPNGSYYVFTQVGSTWISELNPEVTLVQSGSDWIFTDVDDTKETYNSAGRLTQIEYRNGQTETMLYTLKSTKGGDGDSTTLDRITLPFGHTITIKHVNGLVDKVTFPWSDVDYTYEGEGLWVDRLASVEYQYGDTREYLYEDPDLPDHLTGIRDENGDIYASWTYDDAGRATHSERCTDKEEVDFTYNTNGTTTVTLGNGASRTYDFGVEQGKRKISDLSGDICSSCPGGEIDSRTYDSNGFLYDATDWNGNVTRTVRNSRGLTTARTDGLGSTEQRVTNMTWHSTFRLPTQISTSKNDTDFTYDSNGNPTQITVTDGTNSRTWDMTYNSSGKVLTIDGPRAGAGDTTTFTYNNCTTGNGCGLIASMTDAEGNVTTFGNYNILGKVRQITDPNGLVTSIGYTWRQTDPAFITLTPTSGTARTISYTYDAVGQLKTATFPNGLVLTYTYSDAHYVTKIEDQDGNYISYDYDAMGNQTDVDVYDSSASLTQAVDYVYDLNSRLETITEPGALDTDFIFDDVGNLTDVTDADLAATDYTYDALNRLERIQDALNGLTDFTYDVHDNLTSVTAPNGAVTDYTYDDLDNLTEEDSPDRGVITYTHDAAGNVATMTDARSKVTTYTYDDLNRLTEIELDNTDTITFQYDTGTNAKGRLNKITDPSGETTWTFNQFGDITGKTQKIGTISLTTSYTYDTAGRLSTMTLPSGKVVTYGYDDHLTTSVTVGSTTILSAATYEPFGPVNGWTWGNTTTHTRGFNTRGLMTSHSMVTDTRTLTYDNVGRPATLDDLRHDLDFDYNALGQITDFNAAGSAPLTSQDYTYDENGNRETLIQNSTTYNYTITNSTNRLASTTGPTAKTNTFDAAGNITDDGIYDFAYDDRGRLVDVDTGSVTYEHNGQGQRVKKDDGTNVTLYVYDEAGQLIGEYDGSGNLIQEHVWFNGMPVAVLVTSDEYYVHADHLGTPRAVSDGNTVIWRWESGPFGQEVAQEDPDGDSTDFTYNLRFPGQYYDVETGLHYNYFRTLDPATGRYLESDPIGLLGGLNTYGYVGANPLLYFDPFGLAIHRFPGNVYTDRPFSTAPSTGCQQPIWAGSFIVGWKPCTNSIEAVAEAEDCPSDSEPRRQKPQSSPLPQTPTPDPIVGADDAYAAAQAAYQQCLAGQAAKGIDAALDTVPGIVASLYLLRRAGASKKTTTYVGTGIAGGEILLGGAYGFASVQKCMAEREKALGL